MFKNNFERIQYYHKKGWASEDQLRMYVSFKVITEEEFTKITGKPFMQETAKPAAPQTTQSETVEAIPTEMA